MAVLLIDAFSVVILNLAIPGSSFDYDTSWNSFDCDIHWNFLAVLWIVILACNTFVVVLSDSTLDVYVILSGSPFVFDTPWKYFCLQHSTAILLILDSLVVFVLTVLLILVFPGSFVNWNAPLQ